MWLLNDLFAASAAHTAERMSVMAFDHLEQFRKRASTLLQINRSLLDAFLDSRRDLECFRPHAGTVVFPRLVHGDPEAFFKLLREKYETTVVPGKFLKCLSIFASALAARPQNSAVVSNAFNAALDEFA